MLIYSQQSNPSHSRCIFFDTKWLGTRNHEISQSLATDAAWWKMNQTVGADSYQLLFCFVLFFERFPDGLEDTEDSVSKRGPISDDVGVRRPSLVSSVQVITSQSLDQWSGDKFHPSCQLSPTWTLANLKIHLRASRKILPLLISTVLNLRQICLW